MGPAVGILGFFVGILVVLLVGSALLRAAVALANSVIGPVRPKNKPIGWDWDAEEDDEEFAEYERPVRAIPEPGLAQGMGIVFLTALAQVALAFVVGIILDLDDFGGRRGDGPMWVFAHLFGLAVGFLVMLAMLCGMLPTTPKRASVATLFFYLLLLALGVGIWLLLFILLDR